VGGLRNQLRELVESEEGNWQCGEELRTAAELEDFEAGMGGSMRQMLADQGNQCQEGSGWNLGSPVVHCVHIAAAVVVVASCPVDLGCRRWVHFVASFACLSLEYRRDKS